MKHDEEQRKALGQRLADARNAAGLTLQHVGQTLGYKAAKQTVGHWETGHSVPDALTLVSLCRIYKTSPEKILGTSSPTDNPWRVIAHGMANSHPRAEMRTTLTNFCDLVDAETSRQNKLAESVQKSPPIRSEGKTL